jgi:hypothetical protein
MGRFGGLDGMRTTRKGLVVALFMASTAAFTVSAFADTATGPATAHKTKHASSTKSSSSKTAAKTLLPGECGPTPDQASIGLRALQTELMVAGLKCSADQWNSFTAKFKATIKTDADRLQHVFAKAYGKGGANEMNSFVTQLANDASQRSNAFSEAEYCKQEDILFSKVLALTALDLERFSAKRKLAVAQPVQLCTPDAEPTVTTASATPGAATATPAVATGAAATSATATKASTTSTATMPAKSATPVVATATPAAGTPSAR